MIFLDKFLRKYLEQFLRAKKIPGGITLEFPTGIHKEILQGIPRRNPKEIPGQFHYETFIGNP